MGHHTEDELNGHHHSSDDSSDDDGHSLRKSVQKQDSPKKKESHVESSISSSSSSSSSNSSSRKIASHHHNHHHGDDDDGARALGEEEEVVSPGKNGAEGNAPGDSLEEVAIPATIEEDSAINRVEEIDQGPVSVPETDERKLSEEGGLPDRFVVEREEGNREESEDDEREVSDAPVYDKFLVENSLKKDQKVKAKDSSRSVGGEEASLDKHGFGKKRFDVVLLETLEGVHDVGQCDAPESTETTVVSEPVGETAKPEASEEPVVVTGPKEELMEENNVSSMTEEQAPVDEEKGISDAIVLEGEGDGHAEKSALEETEEEPEIEANGIALKGGLASDGPTNLEDSGNSYELEGKSGHDNLLGGEDGGSKEPLPIRSHRDLSVELGSPVEHQKRFIRQFMTPSPPKRENSVYKIVMALEGLQVGEKCIHGEIDHGVCHQRFGECPPRRMSSSPSFSSRAYRETSTSPENGDEGATPESKGVSAEVRVRGGQKREVDSDWSFVKHDSESGVTTHQTSTIKTETYTDTVVFRREDGFLPRTPGRSPLSGSQSMRAVFNQVDASGPSTPTLKIVHEFPAERNDGEELQDGATTSTLATVEGESEVERILRLQETHDLVCPVCRSCITKRVILRKRKRTTVISTEKWETEVLDEEEENTQGQAHDNIDDGDTVVEQYDDYGCLGCFTFLFRRERSVQRTQIVDVPDAAEAAASVSVAPTSQTTDQSAVRLPEPVAVSPPALSDADFDNRCLPIFFTWRLKTTSPTDAEIVAPLLSKEEKKALAEESSVEVLQTQSRDVPAEDLPSETQQPVASEIQQSPAFEIQPPPSSEILELPAAPGAVGGVQLPVVVVESREDRLCFPFLWRRTSKTTQIQSELIQPLLAKEDVKPQSEDVKHQSEDVEEQSTEAKQQSDEVKQQSEDVEQRTEDFNRIEDDLWIRREVLLEVPVSVPPQEKLLTPSSSRAPDLSETVAESDTSFKAIRVTEAERRVDCLCFPSWSSSETTSEETEALLPDSSRATNSLQGAVSTSASGTEATEHIQTSDSVKGSESTEYIQTSSVLKEVASVTSGHEDAEIVLTSPSFRGAVLSVAPSTEDREVQTAGFNCMDCMDILVPSYPWGPPGTGSRKEMLERAEERSASATSTQFEFSTVGQVGNKGVVILPKQVVSESFISLGSQVKKPQEEVFPIQTTTGSADEPESQAKESQRVIVVAQIPEESRISENEISTMRREDSRCLPLLLPTISWRRPELKTEEILDQSSKSKTAEIKSFVTSENKSSVDLENNSFVALERKSPGAAETKLPLEKEVEKEIEYGDVEVSRNQNQQIEQIHNDIAAEVVDEEEVPLVRKPPTSKTLTPSKVEPLPVEEGQQVIVSVEIDDSSLPKVLERDISYSQDLSRTPSLPTVLPVDGTYEEETREKGSWSCCLPSYTQLATQPIEGSDTADRETGEQAASASSGRLLEASVSHISEESESIFHEEVTKETIIDTRITTQTTTTKSHTDATNGETIDGIRIDTSVSYVNASVQHDEGAVEGTLYLDDHPTFSLQPADKLPAAPMLEEDYKPVSQLPLGPTYSTGYAALARYLEGEEEDADEDAAVNERLADSSQHGVTWKEVEPFKPVSEVEQVSGEDIVVLSDSFEGDTGEEIAASEAVRKVKVPAILSDSVKQDVDREIARGDVQGAQVEILGSFQEDESCYLPKSKWLWGRPKLTSEETSLREHLLGKDDARSRGSGLILQNDSEADSKYSADVAAQQTLEGTQTTTSSTVGRVSEEERCNCLPWSGRHYNLEAQLREPLLGRDTAPQLGQAGRLQTDSEVDSKSDTSAHVTIQQIHEVTHTSTGSTAGRVSDEGECNCFPWSSRYNRDSTEIETTVTVTSNDTVIEVEGTDARSTLTAAGAAAENAGMMDEQLIQEPEYLKSIVFGGLDASLTSLGVVASAAGGDAKTRNVLALGLANLIFGFIAFFYKIQDLHKGSPARFQESVGRRFWINGPLAMTSFLFFGALPVLTFGFSFRELNDHDYKMAATVLVSIIAVIFLGCGKVAAKMTELSYRRTLTTLISTGIVAAVAGFYTGEYISKLLEKYGILDE